MTDKYEVSFRGSEIYLPEKVEEYFNEVREINRTIKVLKANKEAIEAPLKKAMLKHGIDRFQCRYMVASTIKGSPYVAFDTEQMKADGVYEKYAIPMTKDDYVRIVYRKGNDDE